MRVIAGSHRGLKLESPPDERIRPTSDRAREALFNILAHGLAVDGVSPVADAQVVDLCCGTGALGIEALSRGAAFCTFVDRELEAIALAKRNVARARETARARLLRCDATDLPRLETPARLAFLDPPYRSGIAARILAALVARSWLATGAIVSVELEAREALDLPPGYETLDERRYGRARVVLLRHNRSQA
jgi:16S rRNA (guanine966-N2)-methyltransferase